MSIKRGSSLLSSLGISGRVRDLSKYCPPLSSYPSRYNTGHLLLDELGILDAGVHEHGGGGIDASEVHAAAAVLG